MASTPADAESDAKSAVLAFSVGRLTTRASAVTINILTPAFRGVQERSREVPG